MSHITKWVIDPSHSEILFKVKHLMIANVKGEFRKFDAIAETPDDSFEKATVVVSIDTTSIDTNSEDRDKHLKSADFFDVENHPEMTFKGTSLDKISEGNYKLKGILTIRGVGKEVSLDVEYGGMMKDPWGNQKAGFSLSGKINRKDWGLNWNAALEAGGVLVGDEVTISAEVQFSKQA